MEKKKLKLTISGSSKKTIDNIELAKSQGKNSVVIGKKNRFGLKGSFLKTGSQKSTYNKPKANFVPRENTFSKPFAANDFEKRKLAEQRATNIRIIYLIIFNLLSLKIKQKILLIRSECMEPYKNQAYLLYYNH